MKFFLLILPFITAIAAIPSPIVGGDPSLLRQVAEQQAKLKKEQLQNKAQAKINTGIDKLLPPNIASNVGSKDKRVCFSANHGSHPLC
jgi:hypothetical protein